MDSTKQFYEQLDEDEILVLGAGQIQPQRGRFIHISSLSDRKKDKDFKD